MTDLPLRAACIHGRYEKHDHVTEDKGWEPCPGGRDITIDYEAGGAVFEVAATHLKAVEDWSTINWTHLTGRIVAAAIGDGEGDTKMKDLPSQSDRTGRVVVSDIWEGPHFFDSDCTDLCQPVPDVVAAHLIWGAPDDDEAAIGDTDD